ncbi:MAG: preprotein translocase subunit YajC [Candidatus Lariskella arthropodorum]
MLSGLFSSVAFASEAVSTAPSTSIDFLKSMLPLLLIMVVFYFLLIRPQQKKMKRHQEMLRELKKGEKVILSGGIFGSIAKIDDTSETLNVEIAENVKIKVRRDAVLEVLNAEVTSPAK